MSRVYFYYSAMNAGKTTHLLQANHNYQERGMRTLVFTPVCDTRSGVGKIRSRLGLEISATVADPLFDFFEHVEKAHVEAPVSCVLVDEAQFLTHAQVVQLTQVADNLKIPVLAYGLRTDFLGRFFEGSAALMALADRLNELKTVCRCGRKAIMTARLSSNGTAETSGAQVDIGGNERYQAFCRKHYVETVGAFLLTTQKVSRRDNF